MAKIDYNKYFVILLMLVILYISFLLIKPFVGTVVMSIIIGYAFYPLYKLLLRLLKRPNLSAALMTVLVIALLVVTFAFIINALSTEITATYANVRGKISTGNFGPDCTDDTGLICTGFNQITTYAADPEVEGYLQDMLKAGTSFITRRISNIALGIPRFLVDIFLMFFIVFYIFRDGKQVLEKLETLLPYKKSHQKRIMKRLNKVFYAIVYVYLFAALVQGFLGGLGFLLFGISNPILWGIIMTLFSLLPIGSVVIWGPAAVILIIQGVVQNTNSLIVKGLLLIVYGIIIVGFADNVLRLKIIGGKAHIHSVLIILGVLGGLALFGFIGTIIGPLILGLLITLIEIYELER